MVSACVTWKGALKPFSVNDKGLKVNSKTYKKNLEKELLPEVNRIMNNNTWIFIQDSAPSYRANIVQDFLKKKLGKRFIKHTEWLFVFFSHFVLFSIVIFFIVKLVHWYFLVLM